MKPMLASKWEERNEEMFPFYAQPKLDGIRVLIGDDGYAYTRSLKPVRSVEFQSWVRRHRDVLAGLDGEIIVGDPTAKDCYTRTSSAVMSFDNPDIANATLYIFDRWDDPFAAYSDRVNNIVASQFGWPSFVKPTDTQLVYNLTELTIFENQLLEQGHEGVILRRPDSLYKQGRGTPKQGQLIKLKRFDDMEGEIIGFHELMHNGNPATTNALGYTEHSGHKENLVPMNKLGAIEVKLGPEWPSESVRIGSGFNDEDRHFYWQTRHSLIGKIAKFKYFAVGTKDAPRFPIFLGMRDGDDMDTQGSLF